jgi:hypothetical protein
VAFIYQTIVMRHLFIAFVVVCSLTGCNKFFDQYNHTFDIGTDHLHIICDARMTGTVEPWLFEFGDDTVFNANSIYTFYNNNHGGCELDSIEGTASIEYLGESALFDAKDIVRVIKPAGIADTSYRHYEFRLKGWSSKKLFHISDEKHRPNGFFSAAQSAHLTVIMTTNVPIGEAISKANAGMQKGVLTKKKFYAVIEE